MVKGKTILITGGTGSFGERAIERFLDSGAGKIIVYSRDEYKQTMMRKQIVDERVKFIIGDVRDLDRLLECSKDVDVIIHAAAMKHVDICERNKTEAVKTNVLGSLNVTKAALANDISVSINLSADKAVYPAGVYGETKAESERIFTQTNSAARMQGKVCRFANMRYSNVIGSRGSVVEIFEKKLEQGETVTVFDAKMARLVVTQEQIVNLVLYAIEKMVGGEVFLIKSPLLLIADLAKVMQKQIGGGNVDVKSEIREGEKLDAVLVSADEAQRTLVSKEGYLVVVPQGNGVDNNAYKAVYGDKKFTLGEYGTQNAPVASEAEVVRMLYGNDSESAVEESDENIPALEGGRAVRDNFLPYATSWVGEEEKEQVMQVLDSNWLTTGPKVKEFEEKFAAYVGAKYAIAVNSGTAALHCCMGALDINPGDEVITTPFTFLATANVIVYRGGVPVLADIDEKTYNIDSEQIRKKITSRTKAIIPVHYGGLPCNMDEIMAIAKEFNLKVIDDAAHALSARYKGKMVGSLSDAAIFSFHPVKNITTAEGGMITTNDPELAKLCVMHRTHGITKEAMERYGKDADWMYDMQRLGHRYNMTEFQAALGVAQLAKVDSFQQRREEIVTRYKQELGVMPELELQQVGADCISAWHLFTIRVNEDLLKVDRNKIIKALKAENLGVNVHYIPIHLHSYYQKNFGMVRGDFPVTEKVYDEIITLPLFPKMSDDDVNDVIKAVKKVIGHYKR